MSRGPAPREVKVAVIESLVIENSWARVELQAIVWVHGVVGFKEYFSSRRIDDIHLVAGIGGDVDSRVGDVKEAVKPFTAMKRLKTCWWRLFVFPGIAKIREKRCFRPRGIITFPSYRELVRGPLAVVRLALG